MGSRRYLPRPRIGPVGTSMRAREPRGNNCIKRQSLGIEYLGGRFIESHAEPRDSSPERDPYALDQTFPSTVVGVTDASANGDFTTPVPTRRSCFRTVSAVTDGCS